MDNNKAQQSGLPQKLYINTPQVLTILKEIEKLSINCYEVKRLLEFCIEYFGISCKFQIDNT